MFVLMASFVMMASAQAWECKSDADCLPDICVDGVCVRMPEYVPGLESEECDAPEPWDLDQELDAPSAD